MRPDPREIHLGETLSSIALRTAWGEAADLALWRGRPLLVVCVRYYG